MMAVFQDVHLRINNSIISNELNKITHTVFLLIILGVTKGNHIYWQWLTEMRYISARQCCDLVRWFWSRFPSWSRSWASRTVARWSASTSFSSNRRPRPTSTSPIFFYSNVSSFPLQNVNMRIYMYTFKETCKNI